MQDKKWTYYNEFDPAAATWLRELIAAKLIPQGEVDTRSIKDVRADDLRGFTQCHFFAGIGGWSRALQLAGWPEDRPVWTGSCPCQSFSSAGKQKGANDERDLWPVFFELIKACRPEFVFGEQVEAAIKHGWLDRVCANMETEDYTVGAVVLGAHSVNAPHLRQRLYWGATRPADDVSRRCCERGKLGRLAKIYRSESDLSVSVAEPDTRISLAENSASIGCRGRNNADSAGEGWEIQAQGLGDGVGLANTGLLRQTLRQEQTDGNVKCSNVGRMADVSGNGYYRCCQNTDREERKSEERGMLQSSRDCDDIRLADCDSERCDGIGISNEQREEDSEVVRSGEDISVADCFSEGLQRRIPRGENTERTDINRHAGCSGTVGLSGLSPWSDFGLVYCRDGKIRRVPAESLFLSVADGISEGVDESRDSGVLEAERGFPLCKKRRRDRRRTMLLKGYGNAVVVNVAAEFIRAFEEEVK